MASRFFTFDKHTEGGTRSRLRSAIFTLVCVIPCVATVLFGAVDSITWALLGILTSTVAILWCIESWRAKGFIVSDNPLPLPLLGAIVLAAVQLLPFGEPVSAGLLTVPSQHALSLDPYATRGFLRYLVVLFVFLAACLTFIDSEARIRKTAFLVLVFGGLMGFIGILQHIAKADAIYGVRVPFMADPFGPFVNKHHFAAFMEMTAGVACGMIFGSPSREKKFIYAIGLVIMIAAILLTGSRGGTLGLFGVVALSGLLSFVYRRRYDGSSSDDEPARRGLPVVIGFGASAVVIVLLVLFLGGDASLTRGLGFEDSGGDVSNGRLHFWNVAWQIFINHPLIGTGFDSFGVAFTRYDTSNGFYRVEQAHNDYLQTLADAGIAGFACLGFFILLLFKRGLTAIGKAGLGFRRDAAIGALAGCFGMLVHSLFDFPMRTWSNSFFFLLLAAVATVSVSSVVEAPRRRKRKAT